MATVVIVFSEGWEAKMGNDRAVLKVAVGIALSFPGGMGVEQGLEFFQSGLSTQRWIIDILVGVASLLLSISYFTRRKARPGPQSIIEWLNERNQPLALSDKKDD